jgi:hypothetical protein
MKKLDEIETNAKRAIIARNEGSIHYVAPAFISPEDAVAMVTTIRDLLAYAEDPNENHTEECAWVITMDSKSLPCDCYKHQIPAAIKRHLGESAV